MRGRRRCCLEVCFRGVEGDGIDVERVQGRGRRQCWCGACFRGVEEDCVDVERTVSGVEGSGVDPI